MVGGVWPPGQATTPAGTVPGAVPGVLGLARGLGTARPRGGMPLAQAAALEAPKLEVGTSRNASPPSGQAASAL